jgi:hypothetical protein
VAVLIDTDVFCKFGVAELLEPALAILKSNVKDCARLPALPYMLQRGRLRNQYGAAVCDRLRDIALSMKRAPTATPQWTERLVQSPEIDPGEAQLFAAAAEFSCVVASGDKRALRAVAIIPEFQHSLTGKVATLEALLLALCDSLGDEHVRGAVRTLVPLDQTVRLCFGDGAGDHRAALRSYMDSLTQELHPMALWMPPGRSS